MATRLIAGAMSGTSADGVDVAIVAINGHGAEMTAQLICHANKPYDPYLQKTIFDIRQNQTIELRMLTQCARDIAAEYIEAIRLALRQANLPTSALTAAAVHGQTLYHSPPATLQWIDPTLLAAQLNVRVVSDFRRADCAFGGQGAPLVPFAEYILFRHPTQSRVLLNVGGIANLTHLPAGQGLDALRAFDTGPGNCISDWICRTRDPNGPGFDRGGARALQGTPCKPLAFDVLLRHDYFRRPSPKSTDVPEMLTLYRRSRDRYFSENGELAIEDELATACFLTAESIRKALEGDSGPLMQWNELIVSGGGTRNLALLNHLRGFANASRFRVVRTSDELQVPSEAKEAMAFALLGAATLDGVPANVPSCTGATRAVVLGSITPKP